MDATVAALLSAATMTAIVGARYVLSSGAFAWATRLRHPGLYATLTAQIRREIGWSLVSAAIYGIPAGIVAWGWAEHGWTRIYANMNALPLWWLPVSVALYLIAHDTWFYWTHRLMHRPWWFKQMHAVHHASRPPTAWAAMSFHPWEALTGAIVIPLLVVVIPIHIAALAVVLTIMTVMGVSNHMGWEMFPKVVVQGTLGRCLITATHHQRHHDEYRGNYGLYFRFWDLVCGTDRGLGHFRHGELGGESTFEFLDLDVTGLRSTKGNILICLTGNAKAFPDCSKDAAAHRLTIAAKDAHGVRFGDLTPGSYAVSLIHDENANGKLDTSLMIPREGFGFSRNPAIGFGAPKFGAARFEIGEGGAAQTVRMKYML